MSLFLFSKKTDLLTINQISFQIKKHFTEMRIYMNHFICTQIMFLIFQQKLTTLYLPVLHYFKKISV